MISIFSANSFWSEIGGHINSNSLKIFKLIFFCAETGAFASIICCKNDIQCCVYSLLVNSLGTKPTTLSGKQASKVSIPVLAIFAAIVIHKVPFGHNLLCANPNSEYVERNSVI